MRQNGATRSATYGDIARMNRLDTDFKDSTERRGDGVTGKGESHLLHHDLTRVIIGGFFSTHSQLGSGFLEAVYGNGLSLLLRRAGLRVEREVLFEIDFHGEVIGRYRADLIVESKVVVEVKCARAIDPMHVAQLRNYLRAANLRVGLVLNFGRAAEFKRVIL